MEIKAQLNYLRIAPRKVRLIADLIKGTDVTRAESELRHAVKRPARPLLKLLKSAVANARHNFQFDEKTLYVKQILVNSGSPLKRFRPRAFGRASPIRKRTSHILLILDTRTPVKARAKPKKKEGPAVRDVSEAEIKGEPEFKPKTGRAAKKEASRQREAGFVKRMFRRKAI